MARSVGVIRQIKCVNCDTTKKVTWWYAGDEYSTAAQWNEEMLKKEQCACVNGEPHWSLPNNTSAKMGAVGQGVRDSQRAVVYMLPDGDYMVPHTNDYRDDMARTAAEVGVRREFGSLRELEKFQMEQRHRKREIWQREIDEGLYDEHSLTPTYQELERALYESGRNQVLDYDEKSLREGRDRIREKMHEERKRNERAVENFRTSMERGFRVGRAADNERYEKLRRRGR